MVLQKLAYNDHSVFSIQDDTWIVWYPTDNIIEDLEAVNETLFPYDIQIVDLVIKADNKFKEDHLYTTVIEAIKGTIHLVRKRFDPNNPPRIPRYGMILEDDSHDW